MEIFSVKYIIFEILGYPLSLIELLATITGLVSVYLAARAHIWTWPTGILNELAFMVLFYQLQLYSDMLLQGYFLVTTLYGWYYWQRASDAQIVKISSSRYIALYVLVVVLGTTLIALSMQHIHEVVPQWFPLPASYPFVDASITMMSIVATLLLAQKRLESWYFWILVDLVSVGLYGLKGVHLLALEYVVFLGMAVKGLLHWRKHAYV